MTALVTHSFQSFHIQQRPDDGFLSATAMCKAVGKLWANYYQNDTTKAYLSALSGSIGIPTDRLVVKIMKGPNAERGTWVHPKVAIHLAQWLSPEFAVWCTNVIYDWMQGKRVVVKEHRRKVPAPRREVTPALFASWVPAEDLLITAAGQIDLAMRHPQGSERQLQIAKQCIKRFSSNMTEFNLMPIYRQIARKGE